MKPNVFFKKRFDSEKFVTRKDVKQEVGWIRLDKKESISGRSVQSTDLLASLGH